MSGRKSIVKGKIGEREIVNWHKKHGFEAYRTAPMQPGNNLDYPDVEVRLQNGKLFKIEVKIDGHVPKFPFDIIDQKQADLLFLKLKRRGWIVCMRPDLYLTLISTGK